LLFVFSINWLPLRGLKIEHSGYRISGKASCFLKPLIFYRTQRSQRERREKIEFLYGDIFKRDSLDGKGQRATPFSNLLALPKFTLNAGEE